MRRFLSRGRIAAAATLIAAAGTASLIGCSSVTDSLLEAQDPDLVVPETIQNAEGALALYVGAIGRLRTSTVSTSSIQEPSWLFSGLLADEWSTSSTFVQNDEVDQRKIKTDNSSVRDQFRALARARTAANQALEGLRQFLPNERTKMAEMYFVRGFAEMQMAQDYCNGIPLTDAAGGVVTFGMPLPVKDVFDKAAASFDSALAFANATDTSTVRIARAARVGKARALVGNGKVAEAAALVTPALVPTTYEYEVTHSITGGSNAIWGQGASARRYTVGDSLEGNARNLLVKNVIPFFSAQDPRLPVKYTVSANGKDTTKSQDGFTYSRTTTLYGQLTNAAIVNGLDARLIEAEARLVAADYVGMTAILNALRAAPPKLGDIQPTAAQLPPLVPPTDKVAAEDLFFREKAFWTFSRGQRLGDLRRLVRQYKRTVDNVFPVGTHYRGGEYGSDVNLPVPKDEEKNNPNFTGCLDRLP
jgi:starch-binding outer membrane protein, SusD/RagB family